MNWLDRAALPCRFTLATIGKDKVGFTVTETLPNGDPVYIKGFAAWWNAIPCAITGYRCLFRRVDDIAEDQLEKRLQKWYRSAEQHARQLHEVEREDYLD